MSMRRERVFRLSKNIYCPVCDSDHYVPDSQNYRREEIEGREYGFFVCTSGHRFHYHRFIPPQVPQNHESFEENDYLLVDGEPSRWNYEEDVCSECLVDQWIIDEMHPEWWQDLES